VKLLISNNAAIDTVDDGGRTLLMRAAHDGEPQAIAALCAGGANVEARLKGYTPLVLAVRQGHIEAVAALLEGGADPSVPGPKNTSPLMYAASAKNSDLVGVLLAYGADPLWVDNNGYRAEAHAGGHEATVGAFRKFGYVGPTQWYFRRGFVRYFGCCQAKPRIIVRHRGGKCNRVKAGLRLYLTRLSILLSCGRWHAAATRWSDYSGLNMKVTRTWNPLWSHLLPRALLKGAERSRWTQIERLVT